MSKTEMSAALDRNSTETASLRHWLQLKATGMAQDGYSSAQIDAATADKLARYNMLRAERQALMSAWMGA